MIADLYWLPAVLLMATGQGLLLPAIRRTEPGAEAKRQAFALHWLLTAAYYAPLALAPRTWSAAVLARVLLFDPVLNLAAGDHAFAVGQTAASDRALQWVALRVGWPAERVRVVVWVACVAGGGWLVIGK